MAQGCGCNVTVVSSIPTRGLQLLFINIFIPSLCHRGTKPGVEFRHSTCNASKNLCGKWGTELNTDFPLPAVYSGIQREVGLFYLI